MSQEPENSEGTTIIKNGTLHSILTMQEAQGKSLALIVKRLDRLEMTSEPKGRLDKITAQGLALILMVLVVGISFIGALMLYGIDTATSVIGTLNIFLTIIAVYFGLSFNVKSTEAKAVVETLATAIEHGKPP